MTETLPSVLNKVQAVYRLVRAAGPLLISQSEKASAVFANHKLRLAQVEAAKSFMISEANNLAAIRQTLREKYINASPEERVRLRQDMTSTENEIKLLTVYHKAIDYIPDNQAEGNPELCNNTEKKTEALDAWIDTFNDFARKKNQPWRDDLLARALAIEASDPGAFGQRALWFTGTMDEASFHAYAAILDIASTLGGDPIVPNALSYLENEIPTYASMHKKLGNAAFIVADHGLFGDFKSSQNRREKGEKIQIRYGSKEISAHLNQELVISGLIFTPLGKAIAKLYCPKFNQLGEKIFNNCVSQIISAGTVISKSGF